VRGWVRGPMGRLFSTVLFARVLLPNSTVRSRSAVLERDGRGEDEYQPSTALKEL